jgi:hypothetical protein
MMEEFTLKMQFLSQIFLSDYKYYITNLNFLFSITGFIYICGHKTSIY